ncbi:MAG TPA: hypothetical protein VKZ67_07130 [Natronosporangium sp.]|nr:hypothetical protein [Natronosporangium sp.]
MSKQRTRRRPPRTPQQRAAAQARQARRQQRRAARAQARAAGAKRRTGWVGLRRSRAQRWGIAAVAVIGTVLIWLFADWPLAIGLTVVWLVALPALVVLTMGRRY